MLTTLMFNINMKKKKFKLDQKWGLVTVDGEKVMIFISSTLKRNKLQYLGPTLHLTVTTQYSHKHK